MTWKEFKDALEHLGIKDEDEVWYIDVTPGGGFDMTLERDARLGVAVWN